MKIKEVVDINGHNYTIVEVVIGQPTTWFEK